ncbi:MAG: hypothetical protein KatS3mg105_3921 [Gemmatales bacterium]|nr:MAG: hypothetical protein KatS3mg105_3921 [Gemmatales bacterium]
MPANVRNHIIANNGTALCAAEAKAKELGYAVVNLGSFVEGETRQVAVAMAGVARSIQATHTPIPPPACLLIGGETTVTLARDHGLGGRNQEFVLAALHYLKQGHFENIAILSAGTDGEDGPTDAAGACADARTLQTAASLRLEPQAFLDRNDAYHFFQATGDLIRTGLTETNVMDVRLFLVAEKMQ